MSFFGKKKEEEAPKGPVGVMNTGGRIDGIFFFPPSFLFK